MRPVMGTMFIQAQIAVLRNYCFIVGTKDIRTYGRTDPQTEIREGLQEMNKERKRKKERKTERK